MEPHSSSYPGGTSDGRYRDDVDRYNREREYEEQRKQEEQRTWDEYNQRSQGGQHREDGYHQRRKEEQRRKEKARRDKANSRRRTKAAENSSKQSKNDASFNVLGFIFEVFKALILGIFSFVFGAVKLLVSLAVIVIIAFVALVNYADIDSDYPVQSDSDYPVQSDNDSPVQSDNDYLRNSEAPTLSPESTRNDTPPSEAGRNRVLEIPQELDSTQPAEDIESRIKNSSVNFQSEQLQVSGDVTRVWINQGNDLEPGDKGIAAAILWEDGITSTILFRDDKIVRAWQNDEEYQGQWFTESSVLRVQMNEGGRYAFNSD